MNIRKIGDRVQATSIGFTARAIMIWSACPICGKQRWVRQGKIKTNPMCRSCSVADKWKKGYITTTHPPKGSKHYKWKGGLTKCGSYIIEKLYQGDFFFPMVRGNNKGNYVLQHRLVMARSLGRCLHLWELVHHKGTKYPKGSIENKQDNRIENLQLISDTRHNQITILETKITLLESENRALKASLKQNGSFPLHTP